MTDRETMDQAVALVRESLNSESGFDDCAVWEDGVGPETWRSNEMETIVIGLEVAMTERNAGAMIERLTQAERIISANGRLFDDKAKAALLMLAREVTLKS